MREKTVAPSVEDTDPVRPPIGLVLVRPTRSLGSEPFYQDFIAGLESVLASAGMTLVLQVVARPRDELETYRRWASGRDVSAVTLVDLALQDPRVPVLEELGLPVVVVGDPRTAGGFSAVWTDDARAMSDAVSGLYELGHRRIGRVTGPAGLAHTRIRSEIFRAECSRLGVRAVEATADYSEEGGGLATAGLLDVAEPPSAIVYDDDVMALGGLDAARRAGVDVPSDLSILAWDDSALCQLSTPPLAAMAHDVRGIGEATGRAVVELITTGAAAHRQAATAVFVPRASVGPAPRIRG